MISQANSVYAYLLDDYSIKQNQQRSWDISVKNFVNGTEYNAWEITVIFYELWKNNLIEVSGITPVSQNRWSFILNILSPKDIAKKRLNEQL